MIFRARPFYVDYCGTTILDRRTGNSKRRAAGRPGAVRRFCRRSGFVQVLVLYLERPFHSGSQLHDLGASDTAT